MLFGIRFQSSLDMTTMIHDNTGHKVREIQTILSSYQKRNLSLLGKFNLLKTMYIPKLLHVLSILPDPPKSWRNDLESVLSKSVSFSGITSSLNYHEELERL